MIFQFSFSIVWLLRCLIVNRYDLHIVFYRSVILDFLHLSRFIQGSLRCRIFGFCLLSLPQNERKIYKLRQLSLSQFVYFLSTKPSMFTFTKYFLLYRWLCAQKIYKLRQTKLSQFVYFSLVLRERQETKTKYSAHKRLDQDASWIFFDIPIIPIIQYRLHK